MAQNFFFLRLLRLLIGEEGIRRAFRSCAQSSRNFSVETRFTESIAAFSVSSRRSTAVVVRKILQESRR